MLEFIYKQFHSISLGMVLFVIFFMAFLFTRENKGHVIEKLRAFIQYNRKKTFFFFYAVMMVTGTVIARPYTYPLTNVIGFILYDGWGKLSVIGVLNVLMFAPYIILYNIAFSPDKPIKKSFLLSVSTTFLIESSQLLFCSGQFSLSDMLHNTIGGMIGCVMWHIVRIYVKKRHSDINKKSLNDRN